jgi:hypothetical protein
MEQIWNPAQLYQVGAAAIEISPRSRTNEAFVSLKYAFFGIMTCR